MNDKCLSEGRTLQEEEIGNVFKFAKVLMQETSYSIWKNTQRLYCSTGITEKENCRK